MKEEAIKKGRRALLLMQTFSTLGFSVLYGTLILYATQGLHVPDKMATAITGSFIAFNYALHVLGGYIGGRLLSYRGLFLLGMLLQALGSAVIAIPHLQSLIWGIAIFLTGSGLNVICINCMLTQLFEPDDKRRESAFLWNYSGMNCGFLIGFSLSGYFQLHHSYHSLFLLSAVGSLISFSLAITFWKHLSDKNTSYSEATPPQRKKRMLGAFVIALALLFSLSWLLEHATFSNALILFLGIIVACIIGILSTREKTVEGQKKMRAFLILAMCSLIFWTLYQMAPMGLTLFYNRNVDPMLWGIRIAPQWMQNVNTIVIILGGPLMAALNQHYRGKGYKISLPFQFATALFLIGIGFVLLPLGIHYADRMGISNLWWVVGCYLLQSFGELFISPVGYAMIGQLIPAKLQGFAMGTWLMVTGVAAVLSNYFSQYALGSTGSINPLKTNPSYAHAFLILGCISIVGGFIVWSLKSFLHGLIQEKVPTLKDIEPAPYNSSLE